MSDDLTTWHLVVSCEHGGNRIPAAYRSLFEQYPGYETLLHSHRGYDAGALRLARQMAAGIDARLFASTTTRLLIDLNRSPRHPGLYSEISRRAAPATRREIFERHYLPYRQRLAEHIATTIATGQHVLHISSHSFTPMLGDALRNADVAFLYDPGRATEQALCLRWMAALRQRAPQLRLRRNYPYRGQSDGFCTWLRRQRVGADYIGIELEVNQQIAMAGGAAWKELRADIVAALREALAAATPDPVRDRASAIHESFG